RRLGRRSTLTSVALRAPSVSVERKAKPDISLAIKSGHFNLLRAGQPSSVSPFLVQMEKKKPKEILRDSHGYHLEHALLESLNARYGQRRITVQVTRMLLELPAQVPDVAERQFLNEALICYRHGAFRAAVVMMWNLAFDHLLNFILKHHLAAFNAQWPVSLPKLHQKARISAVADRDDFGELKESEILGICKSAGIIGPDLYKILDEKLGKRNTAAHPSTVAVSQIQAEAVIDDLVNNAILKLKV
ncbi:MAG: hypothetical protein ACRD2B_00630, partial [Terriglobia bacterium]